MKRYIQRFFRKKHIFHIDNIMTMILIFAFFKLVGSINFSVLDPIGDAFEDVELTDIVFSKFNKNHEYHAIIEGKNTIDNDVVIVNVGNLKRQEIAQLLNRVNSCKPAAVGIDVFFEGSYRHQNKLDSIFDNMLVDALRNTPNLVLVSGGDESYEKVDKSTTTFNPLNLFSSNKIIEKKDSSCIEKVGYNIEINQYPAYKTSNPLFATQGVSALANLVTDLKSDNNDDEFKVCRKLLTHAQIKSLNDTTIECLALALVDRYKPEKAAIFRKRIANKPKGQDKAEEEINYTGNIYVPFQEREKPRYRAFDVADIFENRFDSTDFKGKIVLFGFLGGDINMKTGEDKFFTPLNERYIGKTYEDMYGVVIHANAITMILQELYINSMPIWLGHVIGLLLTYFCIGVFRSIYYEFKDWYDGLTKLIGILLSIALLFVIGLIFAEYNYRVEFPAVYFAAILLAGDLLEIYYGVVKNIYYKIRKKEIKEY